MLNKKLFTNIWLFLIVFIAVSVLADFYYHNRLTYHKNPEKKGWICRCDFRVFWLAAYNMRHQSGQPGASEKYTVYDISEKFYHFRYAPFAAFMMVPVSLISSPAAALSVWFILLNAAMLLSLLFLVKQLSGDFNLAIRQRFIILWAAFIVSLRFYFMNLSIGQTDVLIAFLFVLFLIGYARDKELLSGIIFALILQFKPFYAPMLFYFMLVGKKRLVLSTIAAFAAFLFAPALVVGFDKAVMLLKGWIAIVAASVPSQLLIYKNQSITYFLSDLLLKHTNVEKIIRADYLFYLIGAGLTLSIYMALFRFKKFVREKDAQKYKYLEVSALIMASLLFSPIAWVASFISLIIPFGVALLFVLNSSKRKGLYIALAAFFILSCIAGTDFTNFIPFLNKFRTTNIAFGTLFLAYTLIYSYKQNAA
ncbi:MAG: glycosyltransferase family 87 protein [Candidatus Omnitrophota bacterium]